MSSGKQLRFLLSQEKPLQIVGAVHALSALLAQSAGFKALYLSGAGVANCSYGLPDLALTSLENVLEDASRLIDAVDLPLLVDIDTGWGGALNIERTIRLMERAGVAAVHIEDQIFHKRCGHRPGKALVSTEEMSERLRAAVNAKKDQNFVVMARTDAIASEGLTAALDRASAYVEAGADMLFIEAVTDITHYALFKERCHVPILANITEFGKTPIWSHQQLQQAGVDIALHPLSASRAMMKAAEAVYHAIRHEGSVASQLGNMQTREELYTLLGYHAIEKRIDNLISGASDVR